MMNTLVALTYNQKKNQKKKGCDPYFKVVNMQGDTLFDYKKSGGKITHFHEKEETRILGGPSGFGQSGGSTCALKLSGDFKVVFYDADKLGKDDKMFSFWMNTGFLRRNRYVLSKDCLDGAAKDKKAKVFHKDFSCTIQFSHVEEADTDDTPDCNNIPFIPESIVKEDGQNNESSDEEEEKEEVKTIDLGSNAIRKLVSKKKMRFLKDGCFFNLFFTVVIFIYILFLFFD